MRSVTGAKPLQVHFALRTKTEEGRQKHSVALMTKDDESVDKMYFAGDVGVWRDE